MRSLKILHTNDNHSNVELMPKRGSLLKKLRTENSLLVDAGDNITGTVYHKMFGSKIEAQMLDYLKYDYIALGNHEFDEGIDGLVEYVNLLKPTMICGNCNIGDDGRVVKANIKQTDIFEKNGVRIGITSQVFQQAEKKVPKSGIVQICDPYDSLINNINYLKENNCDFIILLSHMGIEDDVATANMDLGINVIISSHSHTVLEKPYQTENKTLIVQAGSHGKYIGELDIFLEENNIDFEYQLHNVENYEDEDLDIKKYLKAYIEMKENKYGLVVANTKTRLVGLRSIICTRQTNLGKLICDSFRYAADCEGYKSDFSIINARAIRKDIEIGDITREMIYEVIPFSKQIVILEVTGAKLKAALASGYYVQTSGIEIIKASDGEVKIFQSKNDKLFPIIDTHTYRLVTNNYVGEQCQEFNPLCKEMWIAELGLDTDVVEKYMKAVGPEIEYTAK